jgi:hypothetical protein
VGKYFGGFPVLFSKEKNDESRGSTQDKEILFSREGRVDENSLVDLPKCSIMVKVRHHATTKRNKILESLPGLREK